jgi:phospholipid transport system substrate-binding protein
MMTRFPGTFMRWARRLAACGAVALTLGAAPLAAAETNASPDAAADFVKGLFDRARSLSARPNSRDPERNRQLLAFVRTGVDLVAIARFSTGPFWKQASDAERDRFLILFETFVAQTFGRRLGELTGHELKIVKAVAVAPGSDDSRDMLVMSRFIGQDSRAFGVDWRVRMSDTGPRIIDLVVEGISMAVAQRDEFITVIRNGGGKFAALIAKLEEWTANPDDAVAQKSDFKPTNARAKTIKR